MKKVNLGVVGIFALSMTIMFAGVILPGKVLQINSDNMTNKVDLVPMEYYAASDSAMAKSNSRRMKTTEKIQLMTGSWKSSI